MDQLLCIYCILYPIFFTLLWFHISVMASQNHRQLELLATASSDLQPRNDQSPALVILCEGNPPVTDGFPSYRWLNPSIKRWSYVYFVLSHRYTTRQQQRQNVSDRGFITASGRTWYTEKIAHYFSDDRFKYIQMSLKYIAEGPLYNKSVSVQVMILHRLGDKPLYIPDPLVTQFHYTISIRILMSIDTV